MQMSDTTLQISVSMLAVAALGVCVFLPPESSGLATHEKVGLPRCGFLAHTGVPCPTCGATTAASLFVHGHPARAWRTHPMGVVTVCALMVLVPTGLLSAAAGCRWTHRLRRIPLPAWTALVCIFLGLCLIGWRGRVRRYLDRKELNATPTSRRSTRLDSPPERAVGERRRLQPRRLPP
jgi:hypothetical protein